MLTSTSLELRVYIGGGRRRVCCPRRENAGKICLQVGLGSVHHQVQPLYLGRPPQICTNLNSSPLMFILCCVGLGLDQVQPLYLLPVGILDYKPEIKGEDNSEELCK